MGAYLSEPLTEKISQDESHDHIAWGVSGMQGWRMSMEDAHCCHADIDDNQNSLFGVFDGHGGKEVAEYCAENFHNFLLDCDEYREGDIKTALKKTFMAIDEALTSEEVIAELKAMTGTEEEDEEDEAAMLLEEANMPIGELLERFKGNVKEKLKANGILIDDENSTDEPEGKNNDEKTEVNGHAETVSDEKPCKEKSRKQKNPVKRNNEDVSAVSGGSGGGSAGGSSCASNEANHTNGVGSSSSSDNHAESSSSKEESSSSSKPQEEESEKGTTLNDMVVPDDDDSEGGSEEGDSEEEDEEEAGSDDDDEEFEDAEDIEFQQGSEEVGKDSGTTAVVSLIYKNKLYVANAGDSRCVLCRNGAPIEMSIDHKPEDDEEKTRIERAGGKITMDGRINGGLNLSRAIGDHTYKQNADLPPEEQIVTACPDIKEIELTKDDSFMVIACDGIWNVMTNDEVIDFVNTRLKTENTNKENMLSKICEELFDHCIAPDTNNDGTGCDNMTCIIVKFKNDSSDTSSKKSSKRTNVDTDDRLSKKAKLNAMD